MKVTAKSNVATGVNTPADTKSRVGKSKGKNVVQTLGRKSGVSKGTRSNKSLQAKKMPQLIEVAEQKTELDKRQNRISSLKNKNEELKRRLEENGVNVDDLECSSDVSSLNGNDSVSDDGSDSGVFDLDSDESASSMMPTQPEIDRDIDEYIKNLRNLSNLESEVDELKRLLNAAGVTCSKREKEWRASKSVLSTAAVDAGIVFASGYGVLTGTSAVLETGFISAAYLSAAGAGMVLGGAAAVGVGLYYGTPHIKLGFDKLFSPSLEQIKSIEDRTTKQG